MKDQPKYPLKEVAQKFHQETAPKLPKGVLTINANIPTKELEKLRERYPKNTVEEIFEIK